MALAITRTEATADDLRNAARASKNVGQACRLLAIALILDGHSRTEAARATGMDRQTLRDWVHRYNAEGMAGLLDRARSGRPNRMSDAHLAELDRIVGAVPNGAAHGPACWPVADLQRIIAERFGVMLSPRSISRILNRRGLGRSPVPRRRSGSRSNDTASRREAPFDPRDRSSLAGV